MRTIRNGYRGTIYDPFQRVESGVYDFEFPIDGALFRSFESPDIKDGDCCAKVRMERTEKQLACDVVISGEVVVPCDRCLEDCRLPVHFEGRLLVRISDETGEYDGEVMYLLPVEETLDLTQYLYESIVLSLPYQRVHPEGGCDPEMLEAFPNRFERAADGFRVADDPCGQYAGHHRTRTVRQYRHRRSVSAAAHFRVRLRT